MSAKMKYTSNTIRWRHCKSNMADGRYCENRLLSRLNAIFSD